VGRSLNDESGRGYWCLVPLWLVGLREIGISWGTQGMDSPDCVNSEHSDSSRQLPDGSIPAEKNAKIPGPRQSKCVADTTTQKRTGHSGGHQTLASASQLDRFASDCLQTIWNHSRSPRRIPVCRCLLKCIEFESHCTTWWERTLEAEKMVKVADLHLPFVG